MVMQRCPRCESHVALAEYHPGDRGKRGAWCKPCRRDYMRDYQRNRYTPRGGTCGVDYCSTATATGRTYCAQHGPCAMPHGPTPLSYDRMHQWVRATRGSASAHACEACGGAAQEWAHDHTGAMLSTVRNDGVYRYSLNPDRYQPMCIPCHRRFDYRGGQVRRRADADPLPLASSW